jgi:hypothetical protein
MVGVVLLSGRTAWAGGTGMSVTRWVMTPSGKEIGNCKVNLEEFIEDTCITEHWVCRFYPETGVNYCEGKKK